MAAVHIRNVPDPILRALKRRAAASRRSMQQELLLILEAAVQAAPPPAPPTPLELHTVATGRRDLEAWNREMFYGDDGR